MNRTRAPAFEKAEVLIKPGRPVAIVGPASRSWYRDDGVLLELLEYTLYLRASLAILGESSFMVCARRACALAGVDVVQHKVHTPEADAFFHGTDLLIVLGPRTTTKVNEVAYVERALDMDKGVLVIWANGNADFFRKE